MSTPRTDPGPRLAELTEINELKHENETLRRENAELIEENNKLKHSLDEAVRSLKPQPAPRGLKPSSSQLQATSATADSSVTDSELQRRLNDEQLNMILELRKQLSDVQSRLTVNEQVTAATQRRHLLQEGAYESLPKNSVYEELRFDPTQEHLYTELQPVHIGSL